MSTQGQDTGGQKQMPGSRPPLGEVCRALNGTLSDGVDVHRCLAAKASGRIGARESIEPLIAALLDEDEDVRTDAAEALSQLADPQASKQLLENLLGDPCTAVKLAAIEALAKLQDREVIPWLRRMVKGRDEEIVWDEEEFYSSGWDDWVDIQIKAVDALADLNAVEAVPDIVAAMRDENAQDMTEAAFKALARMGSPGIEALAGFLDEDSTRLRRRAAAALAAADAEEATAPLARAFTDPSPEVRAAVLRVRAARVPEDSRLAAMFEDPDAGIRAEVARLCGQRYPDRLLALLDDPSNSVQVAALTALAGVQDFHVDEALIATLRTKLVEGAAKVPAASARALAALAPIVAVDDLISLLHDAARPLDARLGALQGLSKLGGEQAVAALIGVMDDPARAIRLETMPALAHLAQADTAWPNAAGEALLSIVRAGFVSEPETGDDSRNKAAETSDTPPEADRKPEPAITPEVETAAEDSDDSEAFPTSTLNAMLSEVPEAGKIMDLPDEGIELTPTDMERLAMAKRIKGKKRVLLEPKVVLHEDIHRFAVRVLGDVAHPEVARELAVAVGSTDAEVRLAAADSLTRIGVHLNQLPDDVTESLLAAMTTADRDLKLFLIRALAAAPGEAVTALLGEHIRDEDSFVRTEAVRALSKLGQAGSQVEALLDDPDSSVRLSAAEAVAAAGDDGAVERLVDFAFSFEGYHGRQTARLLRGLNVVRANALFVDALHDPERKRIWSVAIEALEEMNSSQPIRRAKVADYERRV